MKGRENDSIRQQPKLNSLRIQSPLSKTFPMRVAVQKSKILTVFLRFGHWLTIRDVTYYPPKVMVQ
jgi:hypothetical protein